MDLENLYKYSSFLSKYNYLNKSYEVSNIDLKQILNHYKNNIQKYYISQSAHSLNINILKNYFLYDVEKLKINHRSMSINYVLR